MVNFEKHKQNKSLFPPLPLEDNEIMGEVGKELINLIVTEPDTVITSLKSQYDELDTYYNSLDTKNPGSFIKIGSCQRILEIYEHTYIKNDVCKYMLNYIETEEIDAPKEDINRVNDNIKEVKYYCERIRDCFFDVQRLQNKQIDRKGYGGIKTIRKATLRTGYKGYPKKEFENIVRLKETLPKEEFYK